MKEENAPTHSSIGDITPDEFVEKHLVDEKKRKKGPSATAPAGQTFSSAAEQSSPESSEYIYPAGGLVPGDNTPDSPALKCPGSWEVSIKLIDSTVKAYLSCSPTGW